MFEETIDMSDIPCVCVWYIRGKVDTNWMLIAERLVQMTKSGHLVFIDHLSEVGQISYTQVDLYSS